MTPLIDVTFLLIVFFVMSNRLIRDEVAMELELPREATGETSDDADETDKIVVNVTAQGEYYFGARRVDLDELREKMTSAKTRATRPLAARIRAERNAPYGAVEPILVLCAQIGVEDASFAVEDR